MTSELRRLVQGNKRRVVSDARKEFNSKIERVYDLPIREAERQLGAKGYVKAGDHSGYVSPQHYKRVPRIGKKTSP